VIRSLFKSKSHLHLPNTAMNASKLSVHLSGFAIRSAIFALSLAHTQAVVSLFNDGSLILAHALEWSLTAMRL